MSKDKVIQQGNVDFDEGAKGIVLSSSTEETKGPGKGNREVAGDNLPFAKWTGKIDLGGTELDCYVLDDGTRVLSSSSATKAIAEIERGSLQDYAGQKALNPYIDIKKILQETIRFSIPGTQWPGLGITTDHFEII